MSYIYIKQPIEVTGSQATKGKEIIFEQEVKDSVKEEQYQKRNMAEMLNIIHGQCTKKFIDQIRTYPNYN